MIGALRVKLSFVGKIKEVLSADLNIPASKQDLKGWASRKVHDNVSVYITGLDNSIFLT